MSAVAIFDVDGVVSPVHGRTAWGDDVVAGNVFGPVLTSPALCARLDGLTRAVPGLSCWWLTSWTAEMRADMNPFCGRDWPVIAEQPVPAPRRSWWKLKALDRWLADEPEVAALAWCDDHLRPPARDASVRRRLMRHRIRVLLLAPDPAQGLTPSDLDSLTAWVSAEAAPGPGA